MHKVLQTLEEARPKWISMQLQKARKLCCDRSGVSVCLMCHEDTILLIYLQIFILL